MPVIKSFISKIKRIKKEAALYSMLIPGAVWLIIFCYMPMFGIVVAFKKYNYSLGIFGSQWSGFKNFEYFFKTPDAWIITRNTVAYNLAFIILGTITAVLLSILLSEITGRLLSKAYQTVILLPHFLSMVIVAYLLFSFLSTDYGVINRSLMKWFGIEAVSWYSESKYWPYILIFVNLWKGMGYNTVVYLATISGINAEYYEAAVIDGASKLQQVIYITLPFLKPIVTILTILALGRIFGSDFGLFYQVPMDSGALYPVTNVISTYVYRAMSSNIGISSAAGLYQAVVGFVLVVASNLLVKKFDSENALF